jgi:diguanylate cyclase (GGDEF)-like protein
MYLKGSSRLICDVFRHSPVFRIGGDEFAVILQNEDLQNKDELIRKFNEAADEICSASDKRWEQVRVASGIAVYDPEVDGSVLDTVRRADQLMYQNKRKEGERRQ